MKKFLRKIKIFIYKTPLSKALPIYHFFLSLLGALINGFPSRKIKVIGVTGTKGKTTTAEIINKILEEAGYKTAIIDTFQFKISRETQKNLLKMTMPGRFFLQNFLKKAKNKNCDYAIVEITSEGVKQFRHRFINLNSLVFTNISPEHIESHGSFQNYLKAKLKIAKVLQKSKKQNKTIVSNQDSKYGENFLDIEVENKIGYSLREVEILNCSDKKSRFVYRDREFELNIGGEFNIKNALASIKIAEVEKIDLSVIQNAFSKLKNIRGRMEHIETGKNFDVVIDYAHTPDSLNELYNAFKRKQKICVLGNAGGGRDKWKRSEMAQIAERMCDKIFLTNEDPYDEEPMDIIKQMKKAMKNKKPEVIIDRKKAIRSAIKQAKENSVVIISGKGTDPYIMKADGEKEEWDDASVARKELKKL